MYILHICIYNIYIYIYINNVCLYIHIYIYYIYQGGLVSIFACSLGAIAQV